MKRTEIAEIYEEYKQLEGKSLTVAGWVRTIRDSKALGFIELHDGSCFKGIQIVFEQSKLSNYKEIASYPVGSSIIVRGELVVTPQARQPFEIHAEEVLLEGESRSDYPLQKKRHTLEYLRTIAHLRPRTNTFNAVFRVRSAAAFAIHRFFQERRFVYVHSPIITASDAEGAGEMFHVTTLDIANPPKKENGDVNFKEDFFGKSTSLTVSGQLEAEAMALAFGKTYTFGPTFRAENSNTPRHAAEFWMIEPEIAFADLKDDMDLAKDMIQSVIGYVLENCEQDLEFFEKHYDKDLLTRLRDLISADFTSVSYTEAIEILKKEKEKFTYPVEWGSDLQTEHERFLTENIFKKPVFVTDYPKEIKAFYMRQNPDNKTVAAMDLLVPCVGEIIGGSQREERYELLKSRMEELNMDLTEYEWYLDLRRYGSVNHAGFGLGFERLIMYITGISNIRDVLPFPRTPGYAEF